MPGMGVTLAWLNKHYVDRLSGEFRMPTLEFKGKSFIYAHHLSVPFREIIIDAKKSLTLNKKPPSLDNNLIVHGDSLHALKALLPTYAGKINIVCIDPPYNLGGDWSYNDSVSSPLMLEWLKKSANPVEKDDLERHDKWLCMMWPRLKLIKELMSPDGILAVTIDDNELFHLGRLLDDIFGEDKCLACAPWLAEPSGGKEKTGLRGGHEYVLIYHNGDDSSVTQEIRDTGELNLDDELGPYRKGRELMKWGGTSLRRDREGQWYPLPAPDGTQSWPIRNDGEEGHWRWGKDNPQTKMALKDPRIFHWEKRPFDTGKSYKGKLERWVPYEKKRTKTKGTGWGTWLDSQGTNADATRELKQIFGVKVFETPKPTRLFQWLISLHANMDAIVLDCFAGSGTTAHAVLLQNNEDGGNRKFILVQMPESIPQDKPAYKLGFRDVIDITAERIRRVMNGYKFSGSEKVELLRETVNYSMLKKSDAWNHKIAQLEFLEGNKYEEITKSVENGELCVVGTRKSSGEIGGLGGSFTFAELGAEMSLEQLLTGELPTYEALAQYVFYTATGRTLPEVQKGRAEELGYIGETELYRVHLHYQAHKKWLQSNEAALTEKLANQVVNANFNKKRILFFAASKFIGQRELSKLGIEFCQLPFAIHRMLGE